MTGSGNNGLPHSVEPVVDANYVFAFVGATRRLGDEVRGKRNKKKDQPKSSITDEQVDGESDGSNERIAQPLATDETGEAT